MSRITVNESVTRSVSFENNLVDVQTALVRCFQFLEEKRFDEAHAIIEQILNIDPNNTDAHIANFLYQFKLTCAEDVVKNFKDSVTYEDSVFYKRVKRSEQTEFAKNLDSCLRRASDQFNIEQERIRKEEEQRKNNAENTGWGDLVFVFLVAVFWLVMTIFSVCVIVSELSRFRPNITGVIVCSIFGSLSIMGVCVFSTLFYRELKKKRQKQLDQQKTDQAAD